MLLLFFAQMFIDPFPSIRFMIVSTVIVSTVSFKNIYLYVVNSTTMRRPYSTSPTVSPKASSPL